MEIPKSLPPNSRGEMGANPWSTRASSFSPVWLFVTLRMVARQAPLSVGFSRWDGLFPDQGSIRVPCIGRQVLNHWTTREVPPCLFRIFSLMLLSCPSYDHLLRRFYEDRMPRECSRWGVESSYKMDTCFHKWLRRPFTASPPGRADWTGRKESLLFICLSQLLGGIPPSFTFTGPLFSCFHIYAFLSPVLSASLLLSSFSDYLIAFSISFWFFFSHLESPE